MRPALVALSLAATAAFAACANAAVYFEETFDSSWESRWVQSTARENLGAFVLSPGKYHADAVADAGIKTSQDARFYNLAAAFPEPFSNKDKDLVLQLQVKHEQDIDCGGGYVKVLTSAEDLKSFDNNTPYTIMFGPDICGSTKRVHVIFNYKGDNKLIKKTIIAKADELSHLYTLIVHPDQTYEVLIDLEPTEKGSLLEDWDFLPPKKIKDPAASKPADWDERAKIPDPEDKKPDGWDDIPEFIADPDAVKPEDWDDDMDGVWEANKVPNPEYKGIWRPREIPNPDYKGVWVHPEIDNPDYVEDKEIYAYESHAAIGLDLWQVKSGTIFDNILLTDDVAYAKSFAEKTFSVLAKAEKEQKAAAEEAERKKREEEAEKEKEEADKKAEAEDSLEEDEENDEL